MQQARKHNFLFGSRRRRGLHCQLAPFVLFGSSNSRRRNATTSAKSDSTNFFAQCLQQQAKQGWENILPFVENDVPKKAPSKAELIPSLENWAVHFISIHSVLTKNRMYMLKSKAQIARKTISWKNAKEDGDSIVFQWRLSWFSQSRRFHTPLEECTIQNPNVSPRILPWVLRRCLESIKDTVTDEFKLYLSKLLHPSYQDKDRIAKTHFYLCSSYLYLALVSIAKEYSLDNIRILLHSFIHSPVLFNGYA